MRAGRQVAALVAARFRVAAVEGVVLDTVMFTRPKPWNVVSVTGYWSPYESSSVQETLRTCGQSQY
jgi:hypothetical protein